MQKKILAYVMIASLTSMHLDGSQQQKITDRLRTEVRENPVRSAAIGFSAVLGAAGLIRWYWLPKAPATSAPQKQEEGKRGQKLVQNPMSSESETKTSASDHTPPGLLGLHGSNGTMPLNTSGSKPSSLQRAQSQLQRRDSQKSVVRPNLLAVPAGAVSTPTEKEEYSDREVKAAEAASLDAQASREETEAQRQVREAVEQQVPAAVEQCLQKNTLVKTVVNIGEAIAGRMITFEDRMGRCERQIHALQDYRKGMEAQQKKREQANDPNNSLGLNAGQHGINPVAQMESKQVAEQIDPHTISLTSPTFESRRPMRNIAQQRRFDITREKMMQRQIERELQGRLDKIQDKLDQDVAAMVEVFELQIQKMDGENQAMRAALASLLEFDREEAAVLNGLKNLPADFEKFRRAFGVMGQGTVGRNLDKWRKELEDASNPGVHNPVAHKLFMGMQAQRPAGIKKAQTINAQDCGTGPRPSTGHDPSAQEHKDVPPANGNGHSSPASTPKSANSNDAPTPKAESKPNQLANPATPLQSASQPTPGQNGVPQD